MQLESRAVLKPWGKLSISEGRVNGVAGVGVEVEGGESGSELQQTLLQGEDWGGFLQDSQVSGSRSLTAALIPSFSHPSVFLLPGIISQVNG